MMIVVRNMPQCKDIFKIKEEKVNNNNINDDNNDRHLTYCERVELHVKV